MNKQFRKFRQKITIAYLDKPYYNRRVKIRTGGVKDCNKRNDNW